MSLKDSTGGLGLRFAMVTGPSLQNLDLTQHTAGTSQNDFQACDAELIQSFTSVSDTCQSRTDEGKMPHNAEVEKLETQ